VTSCSKELGPLPTPKRPLQITTRTLKEPDFKFELLPLHSPLLGQSLLVSFPPLIDMLKFSGYPYLIRGQKLKKGLLDADLGWKRVRLVLRSETSRPAANDFKASLQRTGDKTPNTKQSLRVQMTLEQACPLEYQRAQCAFKDSMIH
jgi:hypothetical protein